jgi:hypothetical protein
LAIARRSTSISVGALLERAIDLFVELSLTCDAWVLEEETRVSCLDREEPEPCLSCRGRQWLLDARGVVRDGEERACRRYRRHVRRCVACDPGTGRLCHAGLVLWREWRGDESATEVDS